METAFVKSEVFVNGAVSIKNAVRSTADPLVRANASNSNPTGRNVPAIEIDSPANIFAGWPSDVQTEGRAMAVVLDCMLRRRTANRFVSSSHRRVEASSTATGAG